mmetsp:Transcript_64290/g.191589  ORF Transcript_64290/g.191589 Transcript_64290/m.191589 type:complete len:257 (-) Transcript_64290:342-1112(-)
MKHCHAKGYGNLPGSAGFEEVLEPLMVRGSGSGDKLRDILELLFLRTSPCLFVQGAVSHAAHPPETRTDGHESEDAEGKCKHATGSQHTERTARGHLEGDIVVGGRIAQGVVDFVQRWVARHVGADDGVLRNVWRVVDGGACNASVLAAVANLVPRPVPPVCVVIAVCRATQVALAAAPLLLLVRPARLRHLETGLAVKQLFATDVVFLATIVLLFHRPACQVVLPGIAIKDDTTRNVAALLQLTAEPLVVVGPPA